MRIVNCNPDTNIGASAWFVEIEGRRLLLDAGTHPKVEGRASLPLYKAVAHEEVEAVAISHCHHDHVGSLPVAVRHFPKAHVLLTELSYFLVERVLHNSVNVMTRQRDEIGIKEYPLYTHAEVDEIVPVFQGFKYNREIEWAAHHKARAGLPSPTLEFYDAGHALGFSRETEIERLTAALDRALKRKGCVLIPSFALGRTQEILALLALLMRTGKIARQPIYIGGLGRVFTEIYDLEAHRAHRNHTNLQLHEALNLVVLEKNQGQKMKLSGGRLFVLTAGMMSEHTAAHEF